jgi:hypothetical protein
MAAARYVHSRLTATEITGKDEGPRSGYSVDLKILRQLDALERIMSVAGASERRDRSS